ncbi:YL1 nuclear protein-domain-containing protein [Aspergillus pseudoustus]|uniref:YL1 nuclear protein-domain-containing protein n=1 Tax=Aspergillus pseudoustus TaxID=1810923 RepID=A0ABR4KMB5_9EURO
MANDDDRSSSDDEAPVESLIQGRAKRSTAGRHMSALLEAAADDDLALLFEEVEDDNEFAADAAEEGGEEEDMGLESSSDEDDQGPSAQADDLEGERQLEKEEREEKKKRRAREDLRYRITSKKVKVDPTAPPTAPAPPRPRKKSERVSWIPTLEEGPIRSSSRRQTMQNKELTHARLKDSEEKRIRLIATMEEAAKRKAKTKPKAMTQIDRLAEAERVERHNSKSVSRWEEMEKRKAEERRAKIEALQNRRLEGPVISYWSGVATWADGRLTRVGKVDITQKPEKEDGARKKSKKADKEGKVETEQKPSTATESNIAQNVAPTGATTNPVESTPPAPAATGGDAAQQPSQVAADAGQENGAAAESKPNGIEDEGPAFSANPPETQTTAVDTKLPAAVPSAILDLEIDKSVSKTQPEGTAEQPKMVAEDAKSTEMSGSPPAHKPTLQPEDVAAADNSTPLNPEPSPKSGESAVATSGEPVVDPTPRTQPTAESASTLSAPRVPNPVQSAQEGTRPPTGGEQESDIHVDEPAMDVDSPQPVVPSAPAVVEHTGRCLTILEDFDDKTAQSREFNIYFNAKKPPRLTKISSSLCVITSLPSRYRDPDTSLPFANSYAYHEIRHTAAQKYAWSPMLGCYVGPTGVAARGVPERFLNPNAKESSRKTSSPTKKEEGPATVNPNPTATAPGPPSAASVPAAGGAGGAGDAGDAGGAGDAGDAMDVDK